MSAIMDRVRGLLASGDAGSSSPGRVFGAVDAPRSGNRPEITLNEVLTRYQVVDIGPGRDYMIVGARGSTGVSLAEAPKGIRLDQEIGAQGATLYSLALREEYNPELVGQTGILKYIEMRNDAQVRSSLRIAKTPVIAGRWFMEPASNDPLDIEIANFVEWNLFEGLVNSWPQLLVESLLMLDYGRYTFEKVFTYQEWEGKKYIGWKKLSPRHPVEELEWVYDEKNGGPIGLKIVSESKAEGILIPIDKLLVFTFDKEGGDMRGQSILRSAYKHWYYRENLLKIDAIQKERHGIGIPVIKLPFGYSDADKQRAHEIGRTLRTNETAHVVLDPQWELFFAKIEGQPVNVIDSVVMHGNMVYENVLAHFLTQVGNTAENVTNEAAFTKSTRFIAEIVRDVINAYAIPQLVKWNWDVKKFPKLRVRRIGENVDYRSLSFAVRNFVGAGILVPDDQVEIWMRDEMDLPRADPTTARITAAPQLPGTPQGNQPGTKSPGGAGSSGLPRQSTAGNQRSTQAPGSAKVGDDKSGRR